MAILNGRMDEFMLQPSHKMLNHLNYNASALVLEKPIEWGDFSKEWELLFFGPHL